MASKPHPSKCTIAAALLATAMVLATSYDADAYTRRARQPSIEVHLEVLNSLRRDYMASRRPRLAQPQGYQPAPGQSYGQYEGQPHPQQIPFGKPSAPLTPQAQPKTVPQPQPSQPRKTAPTPAPAQPPKPKPIGQVPPLPLDTGQGFAVYEPEAVAPTPPVVKAEKKPVVKKVDPVPVKPKLEKLPEPLPTPEKKSKPAPKMEEAPKPLELLPIPPAPVLEEEADMPELPPLPEKPSASEEEETSSLPPLPALADIDEETADAEEAMPLPLIDEEEAETGLPPLPALPEMDEAKAEVEIEVEAPMELPPLPDAPVEEEADVAPELPALPTPEPLEPETVEDELPALPALPESPTVDAEMEEASPVVASPRPAPAVPSKQEEGGLFSGLKSQIANLLGDEKTDEPVRPAPRTRPKGNPEPDPMSAAPPPLPEPQLEAEPAPEVEAEADVETKAELPELPPLPVEQVDDVPVADAPNRSLPPLDAIVSRKKRADIVATREAERQEAAAGEEALPPLPEMEPAAETGKTEEETAELMELPPLPSAPVPAPMADADEDEMELASLPPLPEPDSKPDTATTASQPEVQQDAKGHKMLRLTFSETETDIPFAMQGAMNELVQHLNANPESRVEAVSYAGSADEQEVIAKRISLSRALAARAYFIDQGIDASRIDVKAKGNKESGGGPAERVDITIKETGEE